MTAPRPQPWIEKLDKVSRAAFRRTRETATPEQIELIRAYIELPPNAFQVDQNARLVGGLLSGRHTLLNTEPCPVDILCEGIDRWNARRLEVCDLAPNFVTLITFVDDVWAERELIRTNAALEDAKGGAGWKCASMRNFDPKGPVWVRTCGMIDYRDARHPASGKPEAAELGRDGMYWLPSTLRKPQMSTPQVVDRPLDTSVSHG